MQCNASASEANLRIAFESASPSRFQMSRRPGVFYLSELGVARLINYREEEKEREERERERRERDRARERIERREKREEKRREEKRGEERRG